MQIATVSDPLELARTISRLYKDHKFLCAIEKPFGGIAIYATDTSAVETLIQARTDYPKGEIVGEYQYLSPEFLRALRQGTLTGDPVAEAFRNLVGDQRVTT